MNDVLEMPVIPSIGIERITSEEEFLSLVMQEIENIKLHATPDQINRLDFSTLHPESYNDCIYGQMTGFCRSPIAAELINACTPVVLSVDGIKMNECGGNFENLDRIKMFKVSPTGAPLKIIPVSYASRLSMLEVYIMTDKARGAVNENIIDYIKGTTKKLNLK